MTGFRTRESSSDHTASGTGYIGSGSAVTDNNTQVRDSDIIEIPTKGLFGEVDKIQGRRKPNHTSRDQSARFNLRQQMRIAVAAANHLVSAVSADDPMEMCNAGTEIVESLTLAIKFKSVRERTWYQALNVILEVAASHDLDRINVEAAQAIQKCIEMLSHSGLDKADLSSIRSLLRRNNFDPWGPISFKGTEAEGEATPPTCDNE